MHLARNSMAVGMGWAQQAKELLADQGECEEAITFSLLEAMVASGSGQEDKALEAAEEIIIRARRLGAADDAKALATLLKGQILIMQGQVEEGAPLVDSAMALAVSGCLGELASAYIFCGTISICASSGDLDRAWEWTNEVGRCSISGIAEYPGDCRMHRAEMLRIRGEWAKAELELASVCEELGTWDVGHTAGAFYELGEVSLNRGDLEAAAQRSPSAGNSVTEGCRGLPRSSSRGGIPKRRRRFSKRDSGQRAINSIALGCSTWRSRRSWRQGRWTKPQRQPLNRGVGRPVENADPPGEGSHQCGRGCRGSGERARLSICSAAVEWWRQVPAPYDEAVSRVALAEVEAPAARVVQLETALEAFVRLGATIDTERILGQLGRAQSSERIAVAMMFTDIEGSTAMLASLGDEAWLAVLRRHDATLRSLFATHRGEVYTGTGDGFFVGFQSVDNASCARLLSKQRWTR